MTNVRRIYVEKRKEYATEAHEIQTNLVEQLGLTIHSLRIVHRYDVQGISEEILQQGINTILAEPMVDHVYDETFPMSEKESVFAIEFLPGQYDQRADSCEQCFQILTGTSSTKVRRAKLIVVDIDKNEDVAFGASGAAGAFLSPLLGKPNKFKDLVTNALKFSMTYYNYL